MNSVRWFLARSIVLLLPLSASSLLAEHKLKNEDCLSCHSDTTLTETVNGKPHSLLVDGAKFKHSIHGSMFSCVDCHTDVKSLAHETPPKKLTCGGCHADAQTAYAHSTHAKPTAAGSPAADCADCHGSVHEIVTSDDPHSPVNHANIPITCGKCHGQKFLMESNGESS